MPEYQKMYVQLFAAVTDALEAMSQQNYGQAADILRKVSRRRRKSTFPPRSRLVFSPSFCIMKAEREGEP